PGQFRRAGRPVQVLRALGERLARFLGRMRLFRSAAFFFRRLFPRRAGPSFLEWMARSWGERRRLSGRMELSEAEIYRWGAGLIGLLLVVLSAVMVLS
ncbi:MAG: hypothetical protein ACPL7G_03125, partial [Chloroflexia bacterium]